MLWCGAVAGRVCKQETIIFLAAAISAGCYYCMWSGFGVNKKLDSAGNTHEFAKVNSIVAVYSKYTRPLTFFENL
jgi:hypothetical protein